MATEIELNTKINTANSAQSIGQLNKSLKDLISLQSQVGAGSSEYGKLAKAINDTEGRIGDLQDGLVTLRGSGVERLNASFGLLREGLTSGDIGKAKVAFDGLKGAMSAIPIFLLIEGFKALIDNWDDVVSFGKKLTNSYSDQEKAIMALNAESEKQKIIVSEATVRIGNQIKILEAQKGSEEKILALKKELNAAELKQAQINIETEKQNIRKVLLNDSLYESGEKLLAQFYRTQGNTIAAEAIEKKIAEDKKARIEEATQKLREAIATEQNIKTNIKVEEIKLEVKHSEDLKKIREQRKKDTEQSVRDANALFEDLSKEQDEKDANRRKEKDQSIKDANDLFEQLSKEQDQQEEKAFQEKQEKKKKALEEDQAIENARFQIASQGIQSIAALSDLAFSIKQANTKKGSAEEEKSARRQFQINKGLQISTATITGIQGVLGALTAKSILPEPLATAQRVVQATLIGATTAATIAKISATQFNAGSGGGGSSSGTVNAGGGGGNLGGGASLPQNQPLRPLDFNQGTVNKIGTANNSQTVQKVVMVEYDVTKIQKDVSRVQANAKFP